ncbi:hypothetical protein P171DRAFT_236823 [Karstenula rhodostoma CBS 690.94]|uniref:Uncharacterized protein n=1 Tax=Karstenula rhodostoma CBS 690.94 TaxID=1392251 RepID=A0A9P4PRQ6_9PLEO|nr:hypothetical protein P171DRAFT_236823 [Karstenula rhodostoma CBS 690.94]
MSGNPNPTSRYHVRAYVCVCVATPPPPLQHPPTRLPQRRTTAPDPTPTHKLPRAPYKLSHATPPSHTSANSKAWPHTHAYVDIRTPSVRSSSIPKPLRFVSLRFA